MHGLLVDHPHLQKILDGYISYDRRAFRTAKRGRIALVDRDSKHILAFTELTGVKEISYGVFLEQYGGHRMTGDMWAQHRTYYEMVFSKIQKVQPIDVSGFRDDGVWVELPDDIGKRVQKSLFDF